MSYYVLSFAVTSTTCFAHAGPMRYYQLKTILSLLCVVYFVVVECEVSLQKRYIEEKYDSLLSTTYCLPLSYYSDRESGGRL